MKSFEESSKSKKTINSMIMNAGDDEKKKGAGNYLFSLHVMYREMTCCTSSHIRIVRKCVSGLVVECE